MTEQKRTDRTLSISHLEAFRAFLHREEKSPVTVEKYLRDVRGFLSFASGRPVDKELVLSYKSSLVEGGYALRSVNSMLASLNSLLGFLGWVECRVKSLKCQRQIYSPSDKELTKAEYLRLVEAAKGKEQLQLVLKTICGTGIRVSELKFFTVEAVKKGEVTVHCKGKNRIILVPGKLRRLLLDYARRHGIKEGVLLQSRGGKPLDRSNIWARMKGLCKAAQVNPAKVFPHNLRKLFARTFYELEKDIAKLADILGHGCIETTRIYIMTTGTEHRRKLERLGLVV